MSNAVNFRSFDVIRSTVVTEKTQKLTEHKIYSFIVAKDATKPEIKTAVEQIYGTTVESVRTLIRKGKNKTFKGRTARRSDVKRAYVRLAADQAIDLEPQGE